jgi:ubiquinone/menaquinone biosynthesis C-methylase UbiE
LSDVTQAEAVQERFARTAEIVAQREQRGREALRERLRLFVQPHGDERALDAGTGTGALALALAPLVREVVALDLVPEQLELARQQAAGLGNVVFVEGDARRMPFESGSFDLTACLKTLHHVARPELVVAELTRLARPGGLVLVVDQLAPVDPLAALELNRFERARDPSTTRVLADVDLRGLFEANGLVMRRAEFVQEDRDLDSYLDLAGCEGEARERARGLVPAGYRPTVGWYLAWKPGL